MFVTSGYEHGPTIMVRKKRWKKKEYQKLEDGSWCSSDFFDFAKSIGFEIELNLIPGKKYRLTIEEIK